MNKVFEALKYAEDKHAGQFRRGSGEAYITHPIKVSYLLASYKKSKKLNELLCAALLHDTLEDTDATFDEIVEKFGPLVASLVLELSNDDDEIKKIGKRDYQLKKMIGMSSWALVIKLVDRLANISDAPTEKMKTDTAFILEKLALKRKLTKTQKLIVEDIKFYLK